MASADLVACEAVTEGLALTEAEFEVDAVEEAVAEAVVALALKEGEGVVVMLPLTDVLGVGVASGS